MKKISEFMVSKRNWILGVMLCLTVACAILSQSVSVNYDMSKYLPDNSSMKNGMNIMEEDFPDMGSSNTIRVMAEGLDKARKAELLEKLEAIPNVESVKHDDSEDYNKDDYSLYVISTEYAYNSPEESAIEDALAEDFGEYNIVFRNDNTGANGIPTWILMVAMVILLTILFIMCESWLEPILFLVTIGFAVMINAGTNIFLGEISSITSSISAILQLVLSMDYSIILLNRYRQEKELGLSNNEAMAAALHNSFISVSSSAMTTVVGLLALVFMNFKIGVDLGVVLAKGVFISLVSVLTVLPALILLFDKRIARTAKKSPHISMDAVARFSHKFRYLLLAVFVVLFIGTYLLQGNTQTVYTLAKEDPIADIFPSENMLVLVYNNADEDKIADLADSLEEKYGVKQVMGYPNLLGKPYTSEEFTDTIDNLGSSMGVEIGSDIDLDPSLLKLIYYHYYDGTTSSLTMEEFLTFLSDDVLNNDTFADAIDDDMREQADRLADFSNAGNLTSAKSIAKLAEFFDMDEETIKNLLLLYYTEYGGVDTGKMTLPTFASFVVDKIAADPDYSSMFNADTLSKVKQLKTFTNTYNITTPFSYAQIANLLGIDKDMVELLFVYYYAQSDGYNPGTMTLPSFVNFLQTDVVNNPTFSAYLDEGVKAQIGTLSKFTDKAALQKQHTSAELAQMLGMDESMINLLFTLHNAQDVSDKTLTLAQFMGFLNDNILSNEMFAESFDDATKAQLQSMNSMVQLAASGQAMTPAQMAGVVGMDEATMTQLYFLYLSSNDTDFQQEMANMTMTMPEFLALLKAQAPEEQQAQLAQMEQLIGIATSGESLPAAQMARILGMDEATLSQLYFLYFSTNTDFQQEVANMTMTMPEFLALLKSQTPADQQAQLAQMEQLINLAVSGNTLGSAELAGITGMAEEEISAIFGYQSQNTGVEVTGMTLPEFLSVAATLAADNTQLQQLNQMVGLAAAEAALDATTLAAVFGVDTAQVQQLFGMTLAAQKTITLPAFTDFLVNTVLSNEAYAGSFTEEQKLQLTTMNQMVQLMASGEGLDANTLASIFGVEAVQVQQLFGLTLAAQKSISLSAFTDFLVGTVLTDEAYAGNFSEEQKTQLTTLNQMVQLAASGNGLDAATLAQTFGMDESLITMIFRLYYGADITDKTMSMAEIVNFILADPVMSGFVSNETMAQLKTMQGLINATVNGIAFTYSELASALGMDSSMLKILFTYHDTVTGAADKWALSLQTVVSFILNNKETFSSMIDSGTASQLSMMQRLMDGTVKGTSYTPSELADLIGMDSSQLKQLYLLYISRYGDTSSWQMSVQKLVNFLNSDVLTNKDFADMLDEDSKEMLTGAKTMIDAVVSGKEYTAAQTQGILSALTDDLDADTIELLYFYHASENNYNPAWTLSVDQLFNHLHDSVLNDTRFSPFIDDEMKSNIEDMSVTLKDGVEMMKTDEYSRMIIYTTLPIESSDTTAFMEELTAACGSFEKDYYLVGNTAMSYEMQQTFDKEMLFITLLTAIAIFLIVLISFRSFVIPALLVLIVQCGVYITVSIMGLQGYSIYFLALLIVECILMGATIDYGILFTNYYRDNRENLNVLDALKAAYNGSIHTIMTSGLIIVLVTGIVGYTHSDPTIAQICRTIATGALSAILLILFVLPGLLALFDKFIVRKKKTVK